MRDISCSWLVAMALAACPVWAAPARPADAVSGAPLLDAVAETTIQRLPTCETTIHTRVSEWKARAAIACKKAGAQDEAACVNAQLAVRADQLKRLRSCRFF